MDLANTKSCPPNSFAQIGQDEEAIELPLFAAVLAAVQCLKKRRQDPNERLKTVANTMMNEPMMAQSLQQ